MYISLEEAKKEVWKRWTDVELRRQVCEYVGEVPTALLTQPKAVVFRQVVTPNFEFQAFFAASLAINLKPLCLEYTGDRFCTRNQEKVLMGKMVFLQKINQKCKSHYLIDFKKEEMNRFSEINTFWGESFVDFNRRFTEKYLSDIDTFDTSNWIRDNGSKPLNYYHHFLAFFICHGVLFENFLVEGEEGKFTREVIRPAIQKVTEHFGLKPLIVRLLPEESEAEPYWCWYPDHLEAEVKALLAGGEVDVKLPAAEGSTGVLVQGCNP